MIQAPGGRNEDGDYPYGGWTVPYRDSSGQRRSSKRTHGLADKVMLFVYPVLLGKGKRFFSNGTAPRGFVLTVTKAASSGLLINICTLGEPLRRDDAV